MIMVGIKFMKNNKVARIIELEYFCLVLQSDTKFGRGNYSGS